MAAFQDVSPCEYFGEEFAPFLRAVGWLERGIAYPTGEVDRRVFDALCKLGTEPWQPAVACGTHGCSLCLYQAEARGKNNLFIPGDGVIYVCPELIVHYMNAHGYSPPPAFCRAVLACPPMRSMEYLKALLDNGGKHLVQLARS
jgi:hypothetical protein